jgi:hypothetical protein
VPLPSPLRSVRACVHLACRGLLLLACGCATAETLFDVDAGASYQDNLTRARHREDFRGDAALSVFASAGRIIVPNGMDTLVLSGYAQSEAFGRYRELDRLELGTSLSYKHKLALGWDAVWISTHASLSYDDYRDSVRDSTRLSGELELGRRFRPDLEASAGVFYDRRYDNHGEAVVPGVSGKVFDLAGRGAFVRGGYEISERLLLGSKLSLRKGDVESTSQRDFDVFLASTAITPDTAFGDTRLVAYRIDGLTRSAELNASWAFDSRSSLNAGFVYARTNADRGVVYSDSASSLVYAYRF